MVRPVPNAVTLRMVVLSIPKTEDEKAMLEEDLRKMDYHRLLEWPWSLKDDAMVLELLAAKFNK